MQARRDKSSLGAYDERREQDGFGSPPLRISRKSFKRILRTSSLWRKIWNVFWGWACSWRCFLCRC